MPAVNMSGPINVPSNPSLGKPVIMDPFSGPKGSPLDANIINPTTGAKSKDPNNFSTGALSTGIGYGSSVIISPPANPNIKNAGFDDAEIPGLTMPSGAAAPDARLLAIGGGRSAATSAGASQVLPYAAQPILAFGGGGSRDAGAGPAYTGFSTKMVTATAATIVGNPIVTGFVNRAGRSMLTGESSFGVSTAASPAVT